MVIDGLADLTIAAIAETTGVAIEVPDHVPYLRFGIALVMPSPGATTRTQRSLRRSSTFAIVENDASVSAGVLAPTLRRLSSISARSAAGKTRAAPFPIWPPLPAPATMS